MNNKKNNYTKLNFFYHFAGVQRHQKEYQGDHGGVRGRHRSSQGSGFFRGREWKRQWKL